MNILCKLTSLATIALSLAPLPAFATTYLYRGQGTLEFRNAGQSVAQISLEDVSILTSIDGMTIVVSPIMDGGKRTIIYYQGGVTQVDEKTGSFDFEVQKMSFDVQTFWPSGGGYRSDGGVITRSASGSCQIRYGKYRDTSRIACWGRTSDNGIYNFQLNGDGGQVLQ